MASKNGHTAILTCRSYVFTIHGTASPITPDKLALFSRPDEFHPRHTTHPCILALLRHLRNRMQLI
jgi:hypothetical protein